jgi:hypothetical protein
VDQLALAFSPTPGIGHCHASKSIDAIADLNIQLVERHVDLVSRFRDLEVTCAQVSDRIETEEDAAAAIDLIAQCHAHIKNAEAAHKQEKAVFLAACQAVDNFFKGRGQRLSAALAPTVAKLKVYRDQLAAVEWHKHQEARERAAEEARTSVLAGTELHRARVERLSQGEQTFDECRDGGEAPRLADERAERAEAARQMPQREPIRIRGTYGATAFVRGSRTFEVIDLDQVPREYMRLDVLVVREPTTQGGIRHIPGLRIFRTEGLRVRARTSPRSLKTPSGGEQAVETSKSADQRSPRPRKPKSQGRLRNAADPRLVVPIKLTWGDQRVLRYYRQALASLQPHDAAEIAKFRAANATIEARLWRKLPHRMEEIEFLYGGSRASPEAGEGTRK